MPIIPNFPKRQTYASEQTRGLCKKEDVTFLRSLQNKLDSAGNIIGRKIHSLASLTDLNEAINLANNDIVIVLGNESILDDGLIRFYLISNESSWVTDKDIIALPFNNLYAKLIVKLIDDALIDEQLASIITSYSENVDVLESDIAAIIASVGTEDCEELVNSRIDENDISHKSLKERIDNIAILCDNRDMKRYGVKFSGVNSYGTRLYNAYGKTAQASTDTIKGKNDFDSIYPWSHVVRCNGYYEEDGTFVVTAYDGEPGFALDGSNGNVWVEIPKFYIREVLDINDDLVMELCPAQLGEYRLPEKFINSDGTTKEKAYIAAYNVSKYNDAPASVSGLTPEYGSYESFLTDIQTTLGEDYCGYTVDDYEIIRFLFCIEYATRNSQLKMYGATKLTPNSKLVAATESNVLTIESTSVNYVVNENCYIADSEGNIVLDDITITAVNTSGDTTQLTIDATIEILDGYSVVAKPWKTGSTDSVLAPSGSPVSNISGMYPCRYRYIENPWGNQWNILYQTLCKVNKIYFTKAATNLSNKTSNKYRVLTYECPESNGYITYLGTDDRFPSCRFPSEINGGNSYTAYADLYTTDNLSDDTTAVLIGGSLSYGVSAGLYAIEVSTITSLVDKSFGTRLSYSK